MQWQQARAADVEMFATCSDVSRNVELNSRWYPDVPQTASNRLLPLSVAKRGSIGCVVQPRGQAPVQAVGIFCRTGSGLDLAARKGKSFMSPCLVCFPLRLQQAQDPNQPGNSREERGRGNQSVPMSVSLILGTGSRRHLQAQVFLYGESILLKN